MLATHQQVLCWPGQHEARALPLEVLRSKRHDSPVPVYTLSVEGPEHNFFAEGILVHNKSPEILCWEVEQKSRTVNFGEVAVNANAEEALSITIHTLNNCDYLDEEQRLLTPILDDPANAFSMDTTPIDLALLDGQRVKWTIGFTPRAAQQYEAQLTFEIDESREGLRDPPKAVQFFGEGISE